MEDNNNLLHNFILNSKNDIKNLSSFRNLLDSLENEKKLSLYINQLNDYGNTPLHLAVKTNKQDFCNLLIKYGASKNIVDNKGQKIVWLPVQTGGSKKIVFGKRYI